ncbi:MAG TPA: hypothetical protein VKV19_07240 [Ktedonobacteraceae bacterium]|nr:hypothetical protein [Ktedonobacteraceae bacterium]
MAAWISQTPEWIVQGVERAACSRSDVGGNPRGREMHHFPSRDQLHRGSVVGARAWKIDLLCTCLKMCCERKALCSLAADYESF